MGGVDEHDARDAWLGGVLAPVAWRFVFLVSVPIGVGATIWAYRSLREVGERRPARIDC